MRSLQPIRLVLGALAALAGVVVAWADAPPAPDQLDREALDALDLALDTWAGACGKNGVEPWFLYIPCKTSPEPGGGAGSDLARVRPGRRATSIRE